MTEENNTAPESGLMKITEDVYGEVEHVTAKLNLKDAAGNPLEKDGFVQSPGAIIELSGAELEGVVLPGATVAGKIFNTNEG